MLYIQAFVFVILMGKLMRKIFFGQLRPAEMEVCYLTNVCLVGLFIDIFITNTNVSG